MSMLPMFTDRMEIIGNTEIYFDRCRRLLECCDMLVLAECGALRVSVWGRGLTASDLSAGGLCVRGEITSVELEPRKARAHA